MILDKSLQISNGQGSITTAGTYYGENWIDLTLINKQQAFGDQMPYVVVQTGDAFANGTSIDFQIVSTTAAATDAAGSGLGTTTVELSSGAIVTASLTANTRVWAVKLPEKITRRYLGLKMVVVGNMSAGTVSCNMTPGIKQDPL